MMPKTKKPARTSSRMSDALAILSDVAVRTGRGPPVLPPFATLLDAVHGPGVRRNVRYPHVDASARQVHHGFYNENYHGHRLNHQTYPSYHSCNNHSNYNYHNNNNIRNFNTHSNNINCYSTNSINNNLILSLRPPTPPADATTELQNARRAPVLYPRRGRPPNDCVKVNMSQEMLASLLEKDACNDYKLHDYKNIHDCKESDSKGSDYKNYDGFKDCPSDGFKDAVLAAGWSRGSRASPLPPIDRREYKCHICPKSFTRKYNLQSHIRCHVEDRPFVCDHCHASFVRKHDLQRHVRSLHTNDRPHTCPHCAVSFARSDGLKRHLEMEVARGNVVAVGDSFVAKSSLASSTSNDPHSPGSFSSTVNIHELVDAVDQPHRNILSPVSICT